ncbi:minichromosome maintenance protein MCM [Candidatus Woesearchaeota archaeon]|nr:minichromosome maintenance protein MCM [Candidatus Woesearchaeota archaeon]
MDATELIRKLQEFFEKNYYAELLEKIRKNEKFIHVDFSKLSAFDPELADLLLDQPEEVVKGAELAIEQIDARNGKGVIMRVKNLPEPARVLIRNVRSRHLGKFLITEGIVRQKSDVRPQVTTAKFECPSCGNTISVIQLDNKFKEPSRCSCGRKGRFKLLDKALIDAQALVLEEVPEQLEGGAQPKRINVFLQNDLVSPLSEKRTNPGARIIIVGSIKEIPIFTRSGSQSTRFDILFEANSVDAVEEDFSDIKIAKKEIEEMEKLAADGKNVLNKLIKSIVPSIYGHDKIKEALLLQMVGGVKKTRDDGGVTRGDIHILLVGDPGGGKSQMLKRIGKIAPKGRFVSGKGVSGAGLTASVVKDEFLQGWSLEAGALVLANKGVICIDELDKMSDDDRSAMHEALEGQTITISKANIQATLRCETTVLAAANPKFGRFDPYETVARQINLPPALINRFDLIFPIKDLPDPTKDEKLAKFILNLHQNDLDAPDLDTNFLRKYLIYARQSVFPKLTDSAVEELKNYFIKMRNSASGEVKSVPISARQLEGLIRLAEGYAKLRLDSKVSKKHAQSAIEILDYCLRQVAFDEETGTIDIDRIATAMPASQRNKIIHVKEIINDLENKLGKTIPLEDVMQAASEKGLSDAEVEEMIQKLKRSGDIFEPRRGFISKL